MISPKRVFNGLRKPRRTYDYVSTYWPRKFGAELSSRGYLGTNVFSRDWDVLVLLDTCRVDALRMVSEDYPFLNDIGSIWSVGATSPEWIASTFNRNWIDEIEDTAYLACNGYAELVLENRGEHNDRRSAPPTQFYNCDWDYAFPEEMGRLEHIWKYEPSGEGGEIGHEEGHTPPRYVTDRGISVGRDGDYNRLILHYSQPHHPYVSNAIEEGRELKRHEKHPWEYIQETGDRETVFENYLDDLRYVLDDVGLLLRNLEAETVVISADHGESFGKGGVYGHPFGSCRPRVRKVPWAVTSATDTHEYEPEFEPENSDERELETTLRALGYK